MIQIRNLQKFFYKGRPNEIHVINDISLDLPPKGMVAVFGKSGCGKTTLLNVIGGLDDFASGALTVDGRDIHKDTDILRNRYIGYVFQNYNLNRDISCFDNVADALRLCGIHDTTQIEERVMAALTNVGMDKFRERTPDTLSGGQQQRVAIARAIVKNPGIILADEPTGNLDEANTVMIMDLLKAISKDHLVLLVTHEANLVDFYCDKVIELADGKVVNIKDNDAANGFTDRDKNTIYLGELTKNTLSDSNTEVSYYGNAPASPVKLKVINNNGKLYVQIETEKVQILDQFSEIKLQEGVYKEHASGNATAKQIDMSKLPPVEGSRYGHLFTFAGALKSGYAVNFKKRKKGKKLLRICMGLFAIVLVFMSAKFGNAIQIVNEAKSAYNPNVFYLHIPDAETSAKLNAALVNNSAAIDFVQLRGNYPSSTYISFRTGAFESFQSQSYDISFGTNAAYLDATLAKDLPLVAGRKDNLAFADILISTKVADALLEKSALGYISQRKDLLGLISTQYALNNQNLRIVGIVKEDEPAVYLTPMAMAKYVRYTVSPSNTNPASDFGLTVTPGEATLIIRRSTNTDYPSIGDTIQIQGMDIKVTAIKQKYSNYEAWLTGNQIAKSSMEDYFADIVKQEQPGLNEKSPEFQQAVAQVTNQRYCTYYDYYYAELDDFLQDLSFFGSGGITVWLYLEKGIEEMKYQDLPGEFYKGNVYRKLYGRYPTYDELLEADAAGKLPGFDYATIVEAYQEEYRAQEQAQEADYYYYTYLLSDQDYITTTKQLGITHPSAVQLGTDIKDGMVYYAEIHSYAPARTHAWLEQEFGDVPAPDSDSLPIVTPDDMFDLHIQAYSDSVTAELITMAQFLVLMCLCMYFIMRSALLSRIKEIGIYRAIGVCKKNLVFRFTVESLVLSGLTVFVGYLCASGFLFTVYNASSLVSSIFYYPLWLALVVLAALTGICLFFGILPVLMLLRKTPSQILAKYDI